MTATAFLLRALPFVLATLVFAPVVRADEPGKCGEAEVIFRDGLKKREAGEYAAAIPLLKQSLTLCRSSGLGALYNLALAEEKLGRTAASYVHYAEFLRDVRVEDERIDKAKEAMEAFRAESTRLRFINLDKLPSGTIVMIDDATLGSSTAGYEIPSESGEHAIIIREPGQSERSLSVDVARGQPRDVDVLPIKKTEPSKFTRRNIGFVIGGVGVANLVAGAITGGIAWSKRDELTTSCNAPSKPCRSSGELNGFVEQSKTIGNASTATFIIGGALTAVGVTLVLLPQKSPAKDMALAPLVLPGGGGVSFSSTF